MNIYQIFTILAPEYLGISAFKVKKYLPELTLRCLEPLNSASGKIELIKFSDRKLRNNFIQTTILLLLRSD